MFTLVYRSMYYNRQECGLRDIPSLQHSRVLQAPTSMSANPFVLLVSSTPHVQDRSTTPDTLDSDDVSSTFLASSSTTELRRTTTVKGGSPARGNRFQVLLCLLLHFGLVVIHGILFVVYAYHWEQRITMNITPSSTTWFPLVVTTVLQTTGTVTCSESA